MVEELGSGTKRIFKYTPLYAGDQVPEIYEDDYFTIVIPTPFVLSDTNKDTINRGNDTNKDTINGGGDSIKGVNDTINGVNDTINGVNDTINGVNDTNNDTINKDNVTINGGNVTLKRDNVTINDEDVTINSSNGTINNGELTANPIEIVVNLLKGDPYITGTDLAKHLGVSRRNIVRYLNKLQAEGRIIRVGAKKNGHWEVAEP